ncbi:FAD dependent oxidoreductase-domain-containing protein [Mrakia frigida]|uniref:NAD(P)/FAD-dependent oxidoreductase n=1 Tax=Mrakia frigida TaxID=29902 RepID=UPI003FCBF7DB
MPTPTPPSPPPGLPVPLGALSPWQISVRSNPILNLNRDTPLPSEAQVVLIGSGLTGALTAYSLLTSEGAPSKVVLLEARQACSGASGRNAGHCRPDAYRGFNVYSSLHGPESALAILDSEAQVLDLVAAFIEKHAIDCEFQLKEGTLDVAMTEAFETVAVAAFERVKEQRGGEIKVKVFTGSEGKDISRIASSRSSFAWPAASLNPAKLCLAIHAMSLQLGLELFTHTPVYSVTSSDEEWSVNTSRGSIQSPSVVHCTNAYSGALLDEVKPFVTPVRAQAHQLTAPPAGESYPLLKHSYSIRFAPTHFYSVIQRPDHSIVLGTSRGWPEMPAGVKKAITNSVDDKSWSKEVAENAMEQLSLVLEGSGYTAGLDGKGFEYGWGGIIGMTPDSVPFVGAIPGKKGQFIGAGFNGHGMARIFLCAPSLAKIVLGQDFSETGMPAAFDITEERLARLQGVLDAGLVKKSDGLALN